MLLKCLVKHYVRTNLGEIKGECTIGSVPLVWKYSCVGPITVVTGKTRRVTFVEVKNDINHMIDVAKVADLVSVCTAPIAIPMC